MDKRNVTVLLLAGGKGTRMQREIPKQFLTLGNKPIALYSFHTFLAMPEIGEIVVVCHPKYRHLFAQSNPDVKIAFALPGERRQDSLLNGFNQSKKLCNIVCTHDAARPFFSSNLTKNVIEAAKLHGASTAALPVKYTMKQGNREHLVEKTLDRSLIWEIQTPQALTLDLLQEGLERVSHLNVTDDVSLAELLGKEVKLVEGEDKNLKITTPFDLVVAEKMLETL